MSLNSEYWLFINILATHSHIKFRLREFLLFIFLHEFRSIKSTVKIYSMPFFSKVAQNESRWMDEEESQRR